MSSDVHDKKKENRLVSISTILSSFAILLSCISLYLSYENYVDSTNITAIKTKYDELLYLRKLSIDYEEISHLLVLPGKYESTARIVANATNGIDEKERSRFLLKESSVANYLFGIFELTFYQYNQAIEADDVARRDFYKEVLDYFTDRLLRNPRLLYFWSSTGGGLEDHFEEKTKKYYKDNVFGSSDNPLLYLPDAKGPI